METEGKDILVKIKEKMWNKSFYIAIDETTDCSGRAMAVVLAGVLDGDPRPA